MTLVERFVVGVDVASFSGRNTRRQVLIQRELDRILDGAAEAAGLDRGLWTRQIEGDGEAAVLPAEVDLLVPVRRFVAELDSLLADHNEDHDPAARIRLRVAMHLDVLTPAALGYAGPALIVLKRLLDSPPVRTALNGSAGANLVQIISESVYAKTVMQELGGLRPRQFRRVQIDLPAKGFQQIAYVHVPGQGPGPVPDQREPVRREEPPGFPLPTPRIRAARVEHREENAPEEAEQRPVPAPVELGAGIRDGIVRIRELLARKEIGCADALTTEVLLEAAGRGGKGWLRAADGTDLPDALLNELDDAWAGSSEGAWGFGAQRRRLDGLALTGPKEFRRLALVLGWRRDEDTVMPRYEEFTGTERPDGPFFPTLRNPERERYPSWYDEWSGTAMAVHVRLQHWRADHG